MIGRLYLFPLGARERTKLEAAVDTMAQRYPGMPGFQSVSFFIDEDSGICGSFSMWDSREAAEAATAALSQELSELLEDITQGEVSAKHLLLPQRLIFEIYQPKPPSHPERD